MKVRRLVGGLLIAAVLFGAAIVSGCGRAEPADSSDGVLPTKNLQDTVPASAGQSGGTVSPQSDSTEQGIKPPPGAIAVPPSDPGIAPEDDPGSGQGGTHPPEPTEIQGLVEVTLLDSTIVVDLKYATDDNFTGKTIYTGAKCLLTRGTAEKLVAANKELADMGYRIKVWDAYRPLSAQQTLWDVVSDRSFVADPKKGSIHNRGAAVDVTLVDSKGNELPMPTGFDDFTEKASIDYDGCTEEQERNRELLAAVMVRAGFTRLSTEWWHFADSDAADYPLLDVQFEEF